MSTATSPSGLSRTASESRTLGQMVLESCAANRGPALRWRGEHGWEEMSYAELGRAAREIARGLIALGIAAGDRVAILSTTRPEWTLADCGALCAGAVVARSTTPTRPRSAATCSTTPRRARSSARTPTQLGEDRRGPRRLPGARARHRARGRRGAGAMSLDELAPRGRTSRTPPVDERVARPRPTTSRRSSTRRARPARPKGCMLTHAQLPRPTRRRCTSTGLELDAPVDVLPVPAARARRWRGSRRWSRSTSAGRSSSGSATRSRCSTTSRRRSRRTSPSVPRVFEKIHTPALGGRRGRSPLQARDRSTGRSTSAAGSRARARRAGRSAPALRAAARARRPARAVEGARPVRRPARARAHRRRADRPGRARVLRRLRHPRARGLRDDRDRRRPATLNTPDELRFGTVGRPLPRHEVGDRRRTARS